MSKRTKQIILAVALVQVILIIVLLMLPQAVMAIPGRYRVALAERYPVVSQITEDVIARVAPVADALPAPAETSVRANITIPTLAATSTAPPTLTPTAVTVQADTLVQQETLVDEPTPSPTPLPTATPTPESKIKKPPHHWSSLQTIRLNILLLIFIIDFPLLRLIYIIQLFFDVFEHPLLQRSQSPMAC